MNRSLKFRGIRLFHTAATLRDTLAWVGGISALLASGCSLSKDLVESSTVVIPADSLPASLYRLVPSNGDAGSDIVIQGAETSRYSGVLSPSASPNLDLLLRSGRRDDIVSFSMTQIPAGRYSFYVYTRQDNSSDFGSLIAQERVLANLKLGTPAGSWKRSGPYPVMIGAEGNLEFKSLGNRLTIVGIELWKESGNTPPSNPPKLPSPFPTASPSPFPTASPTAVPSTRPSATPAPVPTLTPPPAPTPSPTRSPIAMPAPIPSSVTPPPPADSALFSQAMAVIRGPGNTCTSCHGTNSFYGDFLAPVTESDWIMSRYVVAGDPFTSGIYYRIRNSLGGNPNEKEMPPAGNGPNQAQLATLENWIRGLKTAPAPVPSVVVPPPVVVPPAPPVVVPPPPVVVVPPAPPATPPSVSGPTFFRGVDLHGSGMMVEGRGWSAGSATATSPGANVWVNTTTPLQPAVSDAAFTSMIKSFFWGAPVSAAISDIPTGEYLVYVYGWEDDTPSTFNVVVNGVVAQSNVNSGQAGQWWKLGPYRTNVGTTGRITVASAGGVANFSGIEIWKAAPPEPAGVYTPIFTKVPNTNRIDCGTGNTASVAYATQVLPILEQNCLGCHSGTAPTGNLSLASFSTEAGAFANLALFKQVVESIDEERMPPKPRAALGAAERDRIANWYDAAALRKMADPGFTDSRRLTRREFDNTIRDLFGLADIQPSLSSDLYADGAGQHGFDNIAKGMSLDKTRMSGQIAAAEKVAAAILGDPSSTAYKSLVTCTPGDESACGRQILGPFLEKAYRRQVSTAEVDTLLAAFINSPGVKTAIPSFVGRVQLAVAAALSSPHFVFRVEIDNSKDPLVVKALSNFEIASRLSYLLWSTMPDAELFRAARAGELTNAENLKRQARRMLASNESRSTEFVKNFAGQWLQFRDTAFLSRSALPVESMMPIPDYTYDAIKGDIGVESSLFVKNLLDTNAPIQELITANYSFLNDRVAKLYELPVSGGNFRRVDLPASSKRRGILTHASVLAATSDVAKTSPTHRGKWVLDRIFCATPPLPASGAALVADSISRNQPARTIMELHRANPACAGCHIKMDPIGVGLENYDWIGRWRATERGFLIDPSESLVGNRFRDPLELVQIAADMDVLPQCTSEHLFVYALGRAPEPSDTCRIKGAVSRTRAGGNRILDLVDQIVSDPAFRTRRAPGVY